MLHPSVLKNMKSLKFPHLEIDSLLIFGQGPSLLLDNGALDHDRTLRLVEV